MKSPGTEWALILVPPLALNVYRNLGDPDLDTISECVRGTVARIPNGRLVLAAAETALGVWFYRHIVRGL